METYSTIRAYIAAQPKEHQSMLRDMYALIKESAPAAKEAIKYGMPTFVGKKNLVHFAGMKQHLGFYPTPGAIVHFASELATYSTSKGCMRFPYTKPLPKKVIQSMVKFRVREDG